MFCIYAIENKINNKLYIGQTSKTALERWETHKKNARKKINRKLYDAINKYGESNFILHEVSLARTKQEANAIEILLISLFNTNGVDGYNMTIGGDGGNTLTGWSEEDRARLYARQAKPRVGQKRSEDTKRNISNACTGRRVSQDAKDKIRATLRSKYASGEIKPTTPETKYGADHPNYIETCPSQIVELALMGFCLEQICVRAGVSKHVVRRVIKEQFNLKFIDFRRAYAFKA